MARRAAVGVGSNVEPQLNIPAGIAALRERFGDVAVSTVYRSPAIDGTGAPFWNLATSFPTALHWQELRAVLRGIERARGRERAASGPPRITLDLDLVLLGDCVVAEPGMVLPAPELTERACLLRPLAEICPDWMHPCAGATLQALWRDFRGGGDPLVPVALPDVAPA